MESISDATDGIVTTFHLTHWPLEDASVMLKVQFF